MKNVKTFKEDTVIYFDRTEFNLKGYRYYIKGNAKSSVTTKIGKRTKPDFQNWYKSNRDNSIKEIMIMD